MDSALAAAADIVSQLQKLLDGAASESAQAAPGELIFAEADIQLVHDFVTEALSHLEAAEGNLLLPEKSPGDRDAVNASFRSFHTIKGVAGFLNLKRIGGLAHVAENLLVLVRDGKLEITGAIADLVFRAADTLRELANTLRESAATGAAAAVHPGVADLIEQLKAAARGELAPKAVEPQAHPMRRAADRPAADVSVDVTMPRLNGVDTMRRIREISNETEVVALSMHSGSTVACDMLRAAASSYILKAASIDCLITAIKTIVTGETFLPPDVAALVPQTLLRPHLDETSHKGESLSEREKEVLFSSRKA